MMDQMFKTLLRGFRKFYRRLYLVYTKNNCSWEIYL